MGPTSGGAGVLQGAPSVRERSRTRLGLPTDLLSRLRWIQFLAAIVMLVVRVVVLTLVGLSVPWIVLVAVACLWLGWRWSRQYRGTTLSLAGDVAEGVVLAGLAFPDPVSILGLLYPALFFRALYGSAQRVLLLLGLYVAAFMVPLSIMEPATLSAGSTAFQVAGLAIVALTMYLFASSLTERQRIGAREQALQTAAVELAAAAERPEIADVARRAVRQLLSPYDATNVVVSLEGDEQRHTASGNVTGPSSSLDDDQRRLQGNHVTTLPLSVDGRAVGRLTVESRTPLSAETTSLLATMATQASAAVARADLAAELHRREGDERFRSLVQHSTDITSVYELDGKIRYASPAMEQVLDYELAELVGRYAIDFVHPDDRMAMLRLFMAVRATPGAVHTIAFRALRRDGTWRRVESTVRNLTGVPAIGGIVGNARDVTERTEAEEHRFAAERRYRTLLEQVPAVTYVINLDEDQVTHYISPRIEDITGFPLDLWHDRQNLMLDVIHPGDAEMVQAAFAHSIESGEPLLLEHRVIGRDGQIIWFQHAAEQFRDDVSESPVWHGVLLDVTSRKEAEEQAQLLRETSLAISTAPSFQEGLRRAVRVVCETTGWAYGGTWVPNEVGTMISAGPHWAAEGVSNAFIAASAAMDGRRLTTLPGRVISSRQPVWIASLADDPHFRRKDLALESGLAAALAVPVLADSDVVAVLEFFLRQPRQEDARLITLVTAVASQLGSLVQARRAEDSLRQSEEQFRAVVETATDAIISVDSEGMIAGWNSAAEKTFGYSAAEAIGTPFTALTPQALHDQYLSGFQHLISGGAGQVLDKWDEVVGLRRDGTEFPMEISLGVWHAGGGHFAPRSSATSLSARALKSG